MQRSPPSTVRVMLYKSGVYAQKVTTLTPGDLRDSVRVQTTGPVAILPPVVLSGYSVAVNGVV